MSFYGFNFQNNPQFSRLFGQNTMRNAQNAYNQGMAQFKPFDARAEGKAYLDKMRSQREQSAQSTEPQTTAQPFMGLYVDEMGRIVNNTNEDSIMNYLAQMKNGDKYRVAKYMRPQIEQLRTDPTKLGLQRLMR